MYEEKQTREVEELAMLLGTSMSSVYRKVFDDGIKIQKKKVSKRKDRKLTGAEFMLSQAKKAVAGPGDSEYDKYAYDF